MLKKSIKALMVAAAYMCCTAVFSQETGGGVIAVAPSPSPDGSQVVFAADFSSPDSPLRLWIVNMDGSGLRRIPTSAYAKIDEEPSWSSTGVIAFSSNDGNSSNIWTVAPDGTRLTQLTSGSQNNRMPTWFPDGSKIAFVSDRSGTNDIWIMNADGTNQRQLTALIGEENHPSFSPDGTAIVFSETVNETANLMIVNVDGTGLRTLTSGQYRDWNPTWGSRGIIFSSNRDLNSEHWKPWTIQPDGTGLRKLSDLLATDPVWTRDGNVLFSDELSDYGAAAAITLYNTNTGYKKIVVNRYGYTANVSIRPFHDPHNVNLNSSGKLRVAILSSATFDALQKVDVTTVRFGHFGTENSLYKCYPKGKDVNGDGYPDLICRFYTSAAGFSANDTRGFVSFRDINGSLYQGNDTIRILPNGPDDPDDFQDSN